MKFIIAILIFIGLVCIAPRHINNQVAKTEVTTKKTVAATPQVQTAEKPKEVQPQIVQDQTVTPLVTSTVPDCDKYDSLLLQTFGDIRTAKAVMRAESSCRYDAVGDNHITYVQNGITYGMSCGLYQVRILPGRPSCEEMKDPVKNIEFAGKLYRASGWQPWSAFTRGTYTKFLN